MKISTVTVLLLCSSIGITDARVGTNSSAKSDEDGSKDIEGSSRSKVLKEPWQGITPDSICGDDDDRVASTDVRQGRIGDCTGWLISQDIYITAGHCGTPSSSTRMHFTFSAYSAPLEDRYAVDVSSYKGVDNGIGNDWGVGRLLPNVITGKLPGVAQSEKCNGQGCGWYTIGTVPSFAAGNTAVITGYGLIASAWFPSRWQKTHYGAVVAIENNYLRYIADTSGGNSGSPVVLESTGHVIGVHTSGDCSSNGGSNKGTRIDNSEFSEHINILLDASINWIDYGFNGRYCGTYESYKRHETTEAEECRSICLANSSCNAFAVGRDCVSYVGCVITNEGETQNWNFAYESRITVII